MSALSLLSIALLLSSLVGCAVVWSRSGETRVGLFGALLLFVAIYLGLAPWMDWSVAIGWNFSSFAGLTGVAVGVLSALAVIALARSLAERDRAEKLHWDSMETVRVINELGAAGSIALDDEIPRLLETGVSRFRLEVGMLARVRGDRYETVAIHAPESFPVSAGAAFPLEETFCKDTVTSERPIGIEKISESTWSGPLERAAFGFRAYLGAPIVIDGVPYGTLSFASFEPRKERFTCTEKDLIRLIAQRLGSEIGRCEEREKPVVDTVAEPAVAAVPSSSEAPRLETPRERERAAIAAGATPTARPAAIRERKWLATALASSATPRARPRATGELERAGTANNRPMSPIDRPAAVRQRERRVGERAPARARKRAEPRHTARVIDPNRILRSSGTELRALAGGSVNFAMKLDPELGLATAQNVPLKAIIRSLVMNARDAMPNGGNLEIETANLEITATEAGQMPTMAPDRYVTISFRDSGEEPDADALSRLFDRPRVEREQASGDGRLALATVYRVLQICGGDLSVKSEPGCGSTLTVYLPCATEVVRTPARELASATPIPPAR